MYNLYYGQLQKIPENCIYTFCNIEKQRILVFSDIEPEGKFVIIPEEIYYLLSWDEKEWFTNAKIEVNKKHMKDNEKNYLLFLENLVEQIEKELKNLKENGDE